MEKTNGSDLIEFLTIREYFAAKAMQGFLANPDFSITDKEKIANSSVIFANKLIHALNHEETHLE